MAGVADATPLIPVDVSGETLVHYRKSSDGASWDSDKLTGCVCDSSWPVGLEANKTQLAEYFGPACEFRRCPSGDDPTTSHINETDCFGKSQTGGSDVGLRGNLCHVDCSGRGMCDYKSGVCTCFKGYFGSNCGLIWK